jgi:tRNA (guanine37-N1)-methyltransferase
MKENKKDFSKSDYILAVARDKGQTIVDDLKEKGLYDNSRAIVSVDDKLWIPLKEKIANAQIKDLPVKKRLKSLKEKFGLSSFDIIGEIIVIFIPDYLELQKKEIGKYLMTLYPKIRAVFCKTTKADDLYRIQSKELIAGEGSETIHYENKLKFKLDIMKVFFSPRQITERMKLVKLIKSKEKICVLFSGIGPIPIYLSKFTNASNIIGIELNTTAHNYALENLALNEVQNVELINGKVERVLPKLAQEEQFDTIIMPIPKDSGSFIEIINHALKTNGRIISYFVTSEKGIKLYQKELSKADFKINILKKGMETASKEWRYTVIARKKESKS